MDSIKSRRAGVGHERAGAAVGEPVRERVGAEEHREGQRDGADLVDRDVGDCRLDALGEDDSDPVPALYPEPDERVGEAVAEPPDIGERVGPLDALRVLDVDRDAIADVRVPVADVDAHVVPRGDIPPEAAPDFVERQVRSLDDPYGFVHLVAFVVGAGAIV